MAPRNNTGINRPEIAMRIARNRQNFSQGLITFPTQSSAHTMLLVFKDYEYEKPGERGLSNLNQSALNNVRVGTVSGIELPIPANLVDSTTLRVEQYEQEYFGAEVSQGASALAGQSSLSMGDMFESLSGPIKDMVNTKDLYDAIVGMDASKLSRDAAFLLRSKLSGNVARNLDVGLGSTVNPKAALAFEGVNLKNHSFNWTLAPQNEADSSRIKAIVERIKSKSLPTYQSFIGRNDKAYLRYPSIVEVYLLGVNAEYFMKFKPSMIASVAVDYSSTGLLSVLRGGKPTVVNLTIDLMEMEIHTSNDYTGESADALQENIESVNQGGPGFRGGQ